MRAAVVVIALVVLIAAVAASALQPGLGQIQITDRVVSETQFGRERIIKTLLFRRGLATPIGNSVQVCTAVGGRVGPLTPGSMQCLGTYRFAHGNLIVAGVMTTRGLYTLSVVGGTGLYSNAGAGQMAAVTINFNPRQQQLTFTLYST